jgi:small subunit ribosomal protein S6
MKHYEVTFIIDPVLSGDELKSTASTYETMLRDNGCTIVHVQEMGLRQLAYPITKKSSGVYYCIEFSAVNGSAISKVELAFRRDERIMRFLTTSLDKYGVQYNDDRRTGKITAYKKKESKKKSFDGPAREETRKPFESPKVETPVAAVEVPKVIEVPEVVEVPEVIEAPILDEAPIVMAKVEEE